MSAEARPKSAMELLEEAREEVDKVETGLRVCASWVIDDCQESAAFARAEIDSALELLRDDGR